MPKNRSRREEDIEDWGGSGTEGSYVNGTGGNSNSNRVGTGAVGEHGDDNEIDYTNNNTGSARPRQHRGGSSQQKQKTDLGQWTQAVSETTQSMGAAHRAIKNLQDKFTLHLDDLEMMEKTRNRLSQLEKECREKDEEIRRHDNTITTLTNRNIKNQDNIDRQKREIEKEQQVLDEEKSKQSKRIAATMAEERRKLQAEFEKLMKEHGQSADKRRKELEVEFAKHKDENSRKLTALEVEKKQLSTKVEEQEKTIKTQDKKLEKTIEQCEVLDRAKDSFKRDKQAADTELELMKREFALSPKSKDYFKPKFAEIYSRIEGISSRYFNDINGKDLEKVNDALVAADPCFSSVPIEDSGDSRNLCIAHGQRIISDAICEYIWKPFCSEVTLSHPEYSDLLSKILDELDKSSQGGRVAKVWTALTMRALHSLPADSLPAPALESKEPARPTRSGRAEGVISKVFSVLSPLVSPSQEKDLRRDLLQLTSLAIDIWNDAQTGELEIIVNPKLEPKRREEWRSHKLDPASPNGNDDETKLAIISTTSPRIFTLFPQVIASRVADPIEPETTPGSWPPEADQVIRTVETCIHPGMGLPEWSLLVVRGKEEQDERSDFLSKAIENAKKELHSGNRRVSGHVRRDSMGSSISGPSSPSQRWGMGGTMKYVEK